MTEELRPLFLDTNVVQALVTFGEYVYDGHLDADLDHKLGQHGPRYRADIDALAWLMPVLQKLGWPLAISPLTLLEHRDYHRLDWDLQLYGFFVHAATDHQLQMLTAGTPMRQASRDERSRLEFLPDAADRAIVDDAISFGCDWFMTLDYKTIWRFRDRIASLGLRVMRPSEVARRFARPGTA